MKILVTGGAGFIGSSLILSLLDKGYEVVCLDNLNEYYDPELKKSRVRRFEDRVVFEKVDLSDNDALSGVFKRHKLDKIAHLAAQAGVRYSLSHPETYVQSNFVGTSNLLELAKSYGVRHVVYAGTSSAYGESPDMPFKETESADKPISIYAATKRSCELMAYCYHHLYGINITILRFFTVYGPFGRPDMALFKFTENILEGKSIDVYNNGDMKRDFTYVDDIVAGFVSALEKPIGYEIINLGFGQPTPLMKFIGIIEQELGKKAIINFMPMQPGDVPATYADISKARALLNFNPKVGVEEGVPNFIKWYKEYYKSG